MTNKFRDALESTPKFNFSKKSIDYISMEAGRWAFRNAQTIEKALTIAAELQDDAETIKALDDVGRGYERGNIIGAYVLIEAIKARPLFKKLAKLVKEGEK